MPKPPSERASERSAWAKSSNILGSNSGEMPTPLSLTRQTNSAPSIPAMSRMRPPEGVYQEFVLPLLNERPHGLDRVPEDGPCIDDFLAELNLALIDAGHVQEAVDEVGEVLDLAGSDVPAPFEILPRARAGRERDGIPDGGQRVPQLVGEHRQELVLVDVGTLQFGRSLLEGVLKLPLFGHVADGFQEPPRLVGVVLQGHDEPLGPERLAVFP